MINDHTETASAVTQFMQDGFMKVDIYVFAHDKDESERLADAMTATITASFEKGRFSLCICR
ncbi:general stress protein [Domibacillus aminovorans]|uniref:general stress protein n=1 Tax=Domibacillus aminovorans TaxID=29332 RepID=UPI0024537EE3|nr:general stress protein [Domibacillus aminovorans]